jgi:hypothetical protein
MKICEICGLDTNVVARIAGCQDVFAIGLVSLLNDASSEIFTAAARFSATVWRFGRAIGHEGLAESISSLLKLFAGYLSDRSRNEAAGRAGYRSRRCQDLARVHKTWTQVLAIDYDRVGKGIRTRRAMR